VKENFTMNDQKVEINRLARMLGLRDIEIDILVEEIEKLKKEIEAFKKGLEPGKE